MVVLVLVLVNAGADGAGAGFHIGAVLKISLLTLTELKARNKTYVAVRVVNA